MLAADRLIRRRIGTVGFAGEFRLVEIDLDGHLRLEVTRPDDGFEDGFDAPHVGRFQLLDEGELLGVQIPLVLVGRAGQEIARLIHHRDAIGRELWHARTHQMHDAGNLRFIQHPARTQRDHHGSRGLFLVAQKTRFLGNGQMHARGRHRADVLDSARELSFHRALVVDLLGELGDAQFLIVHQLETDVAAARQPLRRQPQAQVVHLGRGHQDGAAVVGKTIRHVHLLQGGDDRPAVALVQIGEEHGVVGGLGPQQ